MRINRLRWTIIVGILGAALPIAPPHLGAGELEGRWRSGSWTDSNTGHEGPLKAKFRERADGNYRVVFTGKFAKIIPFRFATTLNVVGHEEGKVVMAGQPRVLGFGRFTYEAVADEHDFRANYSSRRWRGEFILAR